MKLFFLLLIVCLYGCNKTANYKNLLVQGDSTFWDSYNQNHIKTNCYLFKKNGKCYWYYYTKQDSMFLYHEGDVVVPDTWAINADTMFINGYERRIIYLDKDSMVVLNPKKNDTFMFKKK